MTVISYIFYCNIQRTVFFNVYKKDDFQAILGYGFGPAAPEKQTDKDCFPSWYTVQTVETSYISLFVGEIYFFSATQPKRQGT